MGNKYITKCPPKRNNATAEIEFAIGIYSRSVAFKAFMLQKRSSFINHGATEESYNNINNIPPFHISVVIALFFFFLWTTR